MYVTKASKDVDLAVSQYDASLRGIFDGEFCLSILTCYAPDGAGHVVALQGFDVFYLKGLNVEVVEPQKSNRIVEIEAWVC
jgi:hypothetical protein